MVEHRLILAVDTATPSGGVCLFRGAEVLGASVSQLNSSHSNTLLRDIDAVLTSVGVPLSAIDLFAVAAGPGSFTGLRIGVATIKAFAATLDRPCVGIPTLHAVARAAGASDRTVALLPAGRGELFAQSLSVSQDREVTELDDPVHLPALNIVQKYAAMTDLIWAGPGAQSHRDLLREQAGALGMMFDETGAGISGWRLAQPGENLAVEIAALARRRYELDQSQGANSLHALYVRPSDPELKGRMKAEG
jgi:tRNA threonylcarbamoyladenosine biosynthesis protein TsaB